MKICPEFTSCAGKCCREKFNEPNEFIVIGEKLVSKDYDCFKALQIQKKGLCIIGGLPIAETAYHIKKEDLKLKSDGIGCEISEFDIPKKYLSLDVVDDILRLNS